MRENSEILLVRRGSFEVLLRNLYNPIEDIGFELLQLFLVVSLDNPVDLTQRLTQLAIEVILDAIVRTE